MPARVKVVGSLAPLLMHDPAVALGITGGLLAAGGTIKLRHILERVGLERDAFSELENEELELLDDAEPAGYWRGAVSMVHGSLLGWKMRGGPLGPGLAWHRGLWDLSHRTTLSSDPSVDPEARPVDVVVVQTPALEAGELRP